VTGNRILPELFRVMTDGRTPTRHPRDKAEGKTFFIPNLQEESISTTIKRKSEASQRKNNLEGKGRARLYEWRPPSKRTDGSVYNKGNQQP